MAKEYVKEFGVAEKRYHAIMSHGNGDRSKEWLAVDIMVA